MLAPLGYSIVEADSASPRLRCVMAQDFAVILLDVRMPIMDGFETAALIRLRTQSEMTPIIFITAHGSDEIVTATCYAEGAVDFIFAPSHPDELRAKVSVFANLFLKAEELAAQAARCRRPPTSSGCSPTPPRSASSRPTPQTATSTPTRAGPRSPASRPRTRWARTWDIIIGPERAVPLGRADDPDGLGRVDMSPPPVRDRVAGPAHRGSCS